MLSLRVFKKYFCGALAVINLLRISLVPRQTHELPGFLQITIIYLLYPTSSKMHLLSFSLDFGHVSTSAQELHLFCQADLHCTALGREWVTLFGCSKAPSMFLQAVYNVCDPREHQRGERTVTRNRRNILTSQDAPCTLR